MENRGDVREGADPAASEGPGVVAGPVVTESVAAAVRRRGREEITARIVEAALRQLATDGAAGLSLRAVARELGMVSSAVYRYVASRDELLTVLIVGAYDELGEAAESAEAAVPREWRHGRWLAICHAVRDWAFANPHRYALIYGSPVPGYVAPEITVGPAARVTRLMVALMAEAARAGDGLVGTPDDATRRAIAPTRPFIPEDVPDGLVVSGLMAWTYVFGAVSFEVFGHRKGVLGDDPGDRRAFFEEECTRIGVLAGAVP